MRNNILCFFLGAFVAISIAATSTDLMTVRPAKPVDVIRVCVVGNDEGTKTLREWNMKGYIVKTSSGGYCVIMEKYQ